jgi:hypothetical protein
MAGTIPGGHCSVPAGGRGMAGLLSGHGGTRRRGPVSMGLRAASPS